MSARGSSKLEAELDFIRNSSLEESLAYAYKKKIQYGRILDTRWYNHATEHDLFFEPKANDPRVRRLAQILRAISINNVSYNKAYVKDPPGKTKFLTLDYGVKYFPQEAQEAQEAQSSMAIRRALVRNPYKSPAEITAIVNGPVGKYLAIWDPEEKEIHGLHSILADLDAFLVEMSWGRYPFFAFTSTAPFLLSLMEPDDKPSIAQGIANDSLMTKGMSGLQVIQTAVEHHLQSSFIFQHNPLWITTLTIIAYAYMRSSMSLYERYILDPEAPERFLRKSDEEATTLVPSVLRKRSRLLRKIVSNTFDEKTKDLFNPGGGGFIEPSLFGSSNDSIYIKIVDRARHEIMAIRRRELRIALRPAKKFIYPYGYLRNKERTPWGTPVRHGIMPGELDPVLAVREMVAMFFSPASLHGEVGKKMYSTQVTSLATASAQPVLSNIGSHVYRFQTWLRWIEERSDISGDVETIELLRKEGALERFLEKERALKLRSWRIAVILVVLAIRTPETTEINRFMMKYMSAYVQEQKPRMEALYGEAPPIVAPPEPTEDRDFLPDTRAYVKWAYDHLVDYLGRILAKHLTDDKHWGATAYLAYVIYSQPDKTLREGFPMLLDEIHDIFTVPE